MRLLPKTATQGWTTTLCLLPLLILPIDAVLGGGSPTYWLMIGATLLVFLPMFFWAFWLPEPATVVPIVLIIMLGTLMAQYPIACIYFAYAASLAGFVMTQRKALFFIAFIVLVVVVESWYYGLGLGLSVPTAIMVIVFGGFCLHTMEALRANAKLQSKQDEIAQIAAIAERERIARDMHDVLGHTLSLTILKSELARRLINIDADQAIEELKNIESISRGALAQVRETIQGYKTRGIEAEIEALSKTLAEAGVDVHIDFRTTDYDPSSENALSLLLKESVTNVIRHANARHCYIRLGRTDNAYELCVRDDGCGRSIREGSGISGMRERIAALGGTLSILRDGGVSVVATLPLPA